MTSDAVNPRKSDKSDGRQLSPEQAAAAAMVAEARQRGLELTGPDGLLKLFTKNVLETALNEEITEHLLDVRLKLCAFLRYPLDGSGLRAHDTSSVGDVAQCAAASLAAASVVSGYLRHSSTIAPQF